MKDASPEMLSIFCAALERVSAEERAAYVEAACGQDVALRARIETLLQAHEQAGGFLPEKAEVCDAQPTVDEPPVSERAGTVIGPYKLLQQIGEGGMGTVYMAEQTQPVQRKVALKVIKAGMDSRQVIARFEAERQALAMMDHVNIARLLDAGATESGLPYFVMELVHGVPITRYCDDNQLTPRDRLELFVPVCQAIQHAHQKGIIHRDIKPSNVMITLYDGRPVPKVIDFGVAKATEQKLTERTLFTQYGTMVGTLEYMSPEQAEMSALGVDTRSDIYSLGVLLYELLTGSTPLSHKRVREAAYGEVLRMIREEEPPRPSTRLSDSGGALASISAQRHMEPAKLTKLMRGELDWIVMKTLEKDRNRRYETASAFAADVQRYLSDEAVQACPPSAGYRLRKLVRRNKGPVLAASLVLLALVGGIIGTTWGLVKAQQQRDVAEEARNDQAAQRQEAVEQKNRAKAAATLAEDRGEKIKRDLEQLNAANTAIQGARLYADGHQWIKAHAELDRAVKLREKHSLVWFERVDFYTRLGLWDLAAQDYAQAFALQMPPGPQVWFCYAVLTLYVGRADDYRAMCRLLPERFDTEAKCFGQESELVRAATFAAVPGGDLAWAVHTAKVIAARPGARPWHHTALGLAYYRAGSYLDRKQACPPSPAGLPARARGDGTSPSPPGRWLLGTLE
jgi:serine/threonine protein kinase